MRIGCRAHDYGKRTPEELAELLQKRGYNAAQLAIPKAIAGVDDYGSVDEDMAARIGEAFASCDVQISVLGCYMDLSAPDKEVRLNGVENIRHCLRLQSLTGAVVVGSETSYRHLEKEEKDALFPLAVDSIKRIVEEAVKSGGVFAAEPVFWHPFDESLEAAFELIRQVGEKEHFRLILDPVNLLKKKYQKKQGEFFSAWLDAFGEYVEAVHIKDYILTPDNEYVNRPLGTGLVDYTSISAWLRERRPQMPLLREEVCLEHDLEDIAFMRRLLDA